MIKKTITYLDYDGRTITEDFYFHLSKTDIVMLETSVDGGLQQTLEKISKANDTNAIVREFKKIIHAAYGEKSADGKRFFKSEEIAKAFEATPAYDQLFYELLTDTDKAVDFIKQILPSDLEKEITKQINNSKALAET